MRNIIPSFECYDPFEVTLDPPSLDLEYASCIRFSSKNSTPYAVRQRSAGISFGSSEGSQCAARSLFSNVGEIRSRLAEQNLDISSLYILSSAPSFRDSA